MIVHLPIHWRGRVVLHGTRVFRDNLFREVVPITVPELSESEAVEFCRMQAPWDAARGQVVSTRHHEGLFLRPSWDVGCASRLTGADIGESFRDGTLLRHWTVADEAYVRDGGKVANRDAPLAADTPVKSREGDDRLERIAAATRWVRERCTLVDGLAYERCHEPVLFATSTPKGTSLDAAAPDARWSVVFDGTTKLTHSDTLGVHPAAACADAFRIDRLESAVEHAAIRGSRPPEEVWRVQGLEILRPDLIAYPDEERAIAAAAAEAYNQLRISIFLLPRPAAEAVLDLRDARTVGHCAGRAETVQGALSVLEALDPAALPPALDEPLPKALARLRAGILRHETFVAPTPDLTSFGPTP
jgi:hypothetical protein